MISGTEKLVVDPDPLTAIFKGDGVVPSSLGDVVCCHEFGEYQGSTKGSCICEDSSGEAIDIDS